MLKTVIVCIISGIAAGVGTGFTGLSAATVIAPMLISFLGCPWYEAVGIGLASDVLAAAVVSSYCANRLKTRTASCVTGITLIVLGAGMLAEMIL